LQLFCDAVAKKTKQASQEQLKRRI